MLARARVVVAIILWALLVTATYAQDAAQASTTLLPSDAGDSGAGAYRPAKPQFGNFFFKNAAPQASASASQEEGTPNFELFVGYSYLRFNPRVSGVSQTFNNHGGTAALAGNVNRWFSLVADFGFHQMSDLPSGASGNAYTFLFGPQVQHRGSRFIPFAHALLGAARMSVDNSTPVPLSTNFFNNNRHENAFAGAFGGGFDLKFNKHVAWRLIQAEYLMTKFKDGGDNFQNNLRASTGLVFRFGGAPPPPPPNHPPVVTVSANPNKIIEGSGEKSVVQATASDPDNDPLTYAWSATGGGFEGSGPEVRWNSTGLAPGKYTITVKVDDGRGGTASASTDVTIEPKPNRPPTVTCAASPKTVFPGHAATITATGSDPDGDTLTYSFDAPSGKVTGAGETASFDTAGLAPGHYTVHCHANDGRGGTADASTDVEVQKPAEEVQLEVKLALHSIYFPTAQPTEKNPSGGLLASQERTLVTLASDFKKYLAYRPDAHLILQGHADPRGGEAYNKALSERRVNRTKDFLVSQGISAAILDAQGLGEEQPMSVAQVKEAIDQEPGLTAAQKKQLTAKAGILALAQNRRVDVTLSTTGQTSVRKYPFNAEDALNLINPRGVGAARPAAKKPAARPGAKPPAKPAAKPATTKKK